MEKRIKTEPLDIEVPYWVNDSAGERLSPADKAKQDAKEVSEKHRSEIAKRISELTHSA